MKKMITTLLLAVLSLSALAQTAKIQTSQVKLEKEPVVKTVEPKIAYQGLLKDKNGNALTNGKYDIEFKLYDAAEKGNALWTEKQTILLEDGVVNAVLGQNAKMDLPFDQQYWLSLTVNKEEMPRQLLTASPYVAGNSVKTINGATGNVEIVGGNGISVEKSKDGKIVIEGNGTAAAGALGDKGTGWNTSLTGLTYTTDRVCVGYQKSGGTTGETYSTTTGKLTVFGAGTAVEFVDTDDPNQHGKGIADNWKLNVAPIDNGAFPTDGDWVYGLNFSKNGSNNLYISPNNRVGINTRNPQATLDVAGDVNVSGKVMAKNIFRDSPTGLRNHFNDMDKCLLSGSYDLNPGDYPPNTISNSPFSGTWGQVFTSNTGLSVLQIASNTCDRVGGGDYLWFRGTYGGNPEFGNTPWHKIWSDNNDGASSGLDADMLDGKHASEFLTSTGGEISGNLKVKQLTMGMASIDSPHDFIQFHNNAGDYVGGTLFVKDGANSGYGPTGAFTLFSWQRDLVLKSGSGKTLIPDNASFGGNVSIGTSAVYPNNGTPAKLTVNGTIAAEEIVVVANVESSTKDGGDGKAWPDYVFSPEYKMMSLDQVEDFIEANNHLPGVPSASEIGQTGIKLGDMQRIYMEKIEELTLHLIDQSKKIEALEKQLKKRK